MPATFKLDDTDDGYLEIEVPADKLTNRPATKITLDVFQAEQSLVAIKTNAPLVGEHPDPLDVYEKWNGWLSERGILGISAAQGQKIADKIIAVSTAIKKNMGWLDSRSAKSPDSTDSTPEE